MNKVACSPVIAMSVIAYRWMWQPPPQKNTTDLKCKNLCGFLISDQLPRP